MCAATVLEPGSLDARSRICSSEVGAVRRGVQGLDPGAGAAARAGRRRQRLLSLVGVDRLRRILGDHARRGGVPRPVRDPRALALPRRAPVPVRHRRAGLPRRVSSRRSRTRGMFGGNSNWRGPVWFPMNLVILRGLRQLHAYYGDNLKVECPTGSGIEMNLLEVRRGARPSPDLRSSCAMRMAGGPCRRDRAVPVRSALARPAAVPRVLPRRQRGRSRRQPQTGWTGLVAPCCSLRRAASRPQRTAPRHERYVLAMRLPPPPHRSTRSTRLSGSDELSRQLGRPIDTRDRTRTRSGTGSRRCGVDAVWLMGVWARSPAGLAIAQRDPELRGELRAGAARPTAPTTSSARRTACAGYALEPRFGGPRRRWPRRAARARPAGDRPDPRLRAQPRRARPPLDHRAPRLLHPRDGGGPRGGPGELRRRPAPACSRTARIPTSRRGRTSSS